MQESLFTYVPKLFLSHCSHERRHVTGAGALPARRWISSGVCCEIIPSGAAGSHRIRDGAGEALFFTGWKHAGENIADVLRRRARKLPALIQMCDALSRNTPKLEGVEILLANCLAHGRRQFVEVVENFPEQCRYVLETLRGVYHNDAVVRGQRWSPQERLRFHQEHSAR